MPHFIPGRHCQKRIFHSQCQAEILLRKFSAIGELLRPLPILYGLIPQRHDPGRTIGVDKGLMGKIHPGIHQSYHHPLTIQIKIRLPPQGKNAAFLQCYLAHQAIHIGNRPKTILPDSIAVSLLFPFVYNPLKSIQTDIAIRFIGLHHIIISPVTAYYIVQRVLCVNKITTSHKCSQSFFLSYAADS